MRKIFLAGIVWELLRFSFLVISAQKKSGSSMELWLASQQLVLFYIYFFLWYNTDKYSQYMKAAAAGKFLGVAAGIIYGFSLIMKKAQFAGIIFTFNTVLIDALFLLVMLFLIRKYFNTDSTGEENAGNTNSER